MSKLEKLLAVKDAADMVVAIIGAQGEIDARNGAVQKLLDAIHDADKAMAPVFACHVDGPSEPPMLDCTIDTDRPQECAMASRFSSKEECPFWHEIVR